MISWEGTKALTKKAGFSFPRGLKIHCSTNPNTLHFLFSEGVSIKGIFYIICIKKCPNNSFSEMMWGSI